MKPILFNTEMVRAILDGRKTATRRVIKPQPDRYFEVHESPIYLYDVEFGKGIINPPYQPGDILYVRETFAKYNCAEKECIMADYSGCNGCTHTKDGYCYVYKSSHEYDVNVKWKPSIFMPKEAARIFLHVTDVKAERLQDMENTPPGPNNPFCKEGVQYECDFIALWNRTVKKSDLDKYGWDANPWVWVISFECCEKPVDTA